MNRNALILHANGDIEPASVPMAEPDGLEALQAAVGGWIQLLPLPSESISVFCNEDGQMLRLPFNENANALWGTFVNGPILGNVIILGPRRGEDTMELTGERAAQIINQLQS